MERGLRTGGRRVVLFDFDGVLIHGDTFGMFIRDRFAHAWWRKALVVLVSPWLLVVLPFAWRRAARVLIRIGLLGLGEARYRQAARDFAAVLVRRPRQFCRDGVRQLRMHLATGDRVLIVTGCEDTLVRAILEGLGVDGLDVLASRLRAGRLGMRPGWHNIGQRKVELLAQHDVAAWHVAYSDSQLDLPMLALASEPVLVNATPKLCKRVEKSLGRAVTRVEWH
jgi:phosphatidylglycerophosphatase C